MSPSFIISTYFAPGAVDYRGTIILKDLNYLKPLESHLILIDKQSPYCIIPVYGWLFYRLCFCLLERTKSARSLILDLGSPHSTIELYSHCSNFFTTFWVDGKIRKTYRRKIWIHFYGHTWCALNELNILYWFIRPALNTVEDKEHKWRTILPL